MLTRYKHILTEVPGLTDALHHDIQLTHDKPLVHSHPIPYNLLPQLKENISEWLNMDVIERTASPYCSPPLAVRKKDGTHRFCLDCRQLNRVTVPDLEPIADPSEILMKLSKAKYLSKIDLSSGFWQLPLMDKAKPYTAFRTNFGQYQFKVMPFGLINAPASFSRLMRIVTRELSNTDAYMDDLIIYSDTFNEHIEHLSLLFQTLDDYGLTAKPTKCLLAFSQLEYLGHIVGKGQYQPLENKVEAITNTPLPNTVKDLRSFLGSVGYYQRFIPNYSTLTAPLTNLLKQRPNGKSKVIWTQAATLAFKDTRSYLTKCPVLQIPDVNVPFTLRTDASDVGVGAVLCQPAKDNAGQINPIMYASKKLSGPQLNYSAIEKEAYAIYWGIQKFERYLYGRCFTIETDHKPLIYLQSADKLNPRLKRWSLYISFFKFYVTHLPGVDNHIADYLSRNPVTHDLDPTNEIAFVE